jgi:DNA polymerase IV
MLHFALRMSADTCNPFAVVRTVLHVDMDAFYASIEQRDDPSLRGLPVIVGGDRRRGVVLTASYEARPFGVGSAMPMARALRLCPQARVVRPRMKHYADISAQLMRILRRFSPTVEPISLDEAFLDASGEERLLGDGRTIGAAIKRAVREELGLAASVGVATSKFVAKVASDAGKPDGLLVVPPGEEAAFLAPLPVGRLYGVGKKTEELLRGAGFRTVAQIAAADPRKLARAVGDRLAEHLGHLARGEDPREVDADRAAVTVGSEETLGEDTADRALLEARILVHADQVAERLRASGWRARVVVLKVKYADFTLRTRRTTLPEPTVDGTTIAETARSLLDRLEISGHKKVRLVGVSTAGLVSEQAPAQQELAFVTEARGDRLGHTLDQITARFGRTAITRGTLLGTDEEDD